MFGFWYWRNQSFSKEIVKLEILGSTSATLGQEIEYTVTFKNNGNFALENPKLTFEMPEHSLTEDGKTRIVQTLKDLYPGEQNSVAFKTRLLGKEQEVKTAKATLTYVPHNLSVRYESQTTFATKIEQVPITLTYDVPSQAQQGKALMHTIRYTSRIDYPLENASIRIDATQGFAITSTIPRSLDNAEWKLPVLQKGSNGAIVVTGVVGQGTANLHLAAKLGVWVDGQFIAIKEASQDVPVKEGPQLAVAQQVFRANMAGLENTGPIPPVAGQATTYIVAWQVIDYASDMKQVKMQATLPQYVTVGENIVPEEAAAQFSINNRELVWVVGDMTAGDIASVAFQITITPGDWQKGALAELIGQAVVSAQDASGATIQNTASAVNTSLPDDKDNSGGGIVQ